MFGKLKDKLKSSLSVFSKKVKDEVAQDVKEQSAPAQAKQEYANPKEVTTKDSLRDLEQKEKIEDKKQALPESENVQLEPSFQDAPSITKPEDKPNQTLEIAEKSPTEDQPKKSLFERARQKFTQKKLTEQKFNDLFFDIELALLENNVAYEVIDKVRFDLKQRLVNELLPRDLVSVVSESLMQSLSEALIEGEDLADAAITKKPYIISFFGVNGSGKTTTIAKLASYLKNKGYSVVLAAADTFRAAAIHQLEEHANKLNVKLIKHDYGADAAAVAFDTVKYAKRNNIDFVLIDTAGRLHSDTNLLGELQKIVRVTNPDKKIFVGESITGNDCVEQAKKFDESVGIDGIILTKSDVDDKGGAAVSISYVTKKPILYLCNGQDYNDITLFSKQKLLSTLNL